MRRIGITGGCIRANGDVTKRAAYARKGCVLGAFSVNDSDHTRATNAARVIECSELDELLHATLDIVDLRKNRVLELRRVAHVRVG